MLSHLPNACLLMMSDLSLIIFNCSALLYRERAPLNFLPCHYIITLKSWTSNCNCLHRERTLSPLELTVMIAYFLLNGEMWPYLCLCYVCMSVLTEKTLFSEGKNDVLPSVDEGSFPPPSKPVPLTIILLSTKQNLTL